MCASYLCECSERNHRVLQAAVISLCSHIRYECGNKKEIVLCADRLLKVCEPTFCSGTPNAIRLHTFASPQGR